MTSPTFTPLLSTARSRGSPWPIRDASKFLSFRPRHLTRLFDTGAAGLVKLGRRLLVARAVVPRMATEETHGITTTHGGAKHV